MSVTIEINASLQELMTKVGCDDDLIKQAFAAHLAIKYSLSGVTVKSPFGEQLAPLKIGTLQSILSGNLPEGPVKNLAKIHLSKAVKAVLVATPTPVNVPVETAESVTESAVQKAKAALGVILGKASEPIDQAVLMVDTGEKVYGKSVVQLIDQAVVAELASANVSADDLKSVKVWNQPEGDVSAPVVEAVVEAGTFPFKALSKAKVQLTDATALYQPVFGTDSESLYHCVALSPKIKVAIRVKSEAKVSIRVSGDPVEMSKYASNFKAAGLASNGGHCSVHLATNSADLTRKSVGAVLFGLGIPFTQIATDLSPIWLKGV